MRLLTIFGALAYLTISVLSLALPEAQDTTAASIIEGNQLVDPSIATDAPYCGYAYSDLDLTGQPFDLGADDLLHYFQYYRSANISLGCACTFFGCTYDGIDGTVGVSNYHGNLPGDCRSIKCSVRSDAPIQGPTISTPEALVVPALEAKAIDIEEETINCGYSYTEVGLRGTQHALVFPRSIPGAYIRAVSLSAIVPWGCSCSFYKDSRCEASGEGKEYYQTGMMQGNLPFSTRCVKCILKVMESS